jgi:hypothetical protein
MEDRIAESIAAKVIEIALAEPTVPTISLLSSLATWS